MYPYTKKTLPTILCVSKFESRWHTHLKNYFELAGFELEFIYINLLCENLRKEYLFPSVRQIRNFVINQCNLFQCRHVLYDLEFFYFFSPYDIEHIAKLTKTESIALCIDDDTLHSLNRIVFSGVDKIIANGPMPAENYRSYGYDVLPIFSLDVSSLHNRKFVNCSNTSDPYVLFYGSREKADRDFQITRLIEAGIPVKCLNNISSFEDLYKEIAKASLVVNFSKSDFVVSSPLEFVPRAPWNYFNRNNTNSKSVKNSSWVYQYKGRLLEAGFCGSLSVAEFFPLHDRVFPESVMPVFDSEESMINVIKDLLNNPLLLSSYREKYIDYCQNYYSAQKVSASLRNFILKPSQKEHAKLPWTLIFEVSHRLQRAIYLRSPILLFLPTDKLHAIPKIFQFTIPSLISLLLMAVVIVSLIFNKVRELLNKIPELRK
jgi:hypothetical protein